MSEGNLDESYRESTMIEALLEFLCFVHDAESGPIVVGGVYREPDGRCSQIDDERQS